MASTKKNLGFESLRAIVTFALFVLFCEPSFAKWTPINSAPLHIQRHNANFVVNTDASWTERGSITIKINTDSGRALLAVYRFPLGDQAEELKITKAIVQEPTGEREINPLSIVAREMDPEPDLTNPLFTATKSYNIPFGDLPVGAVVRIDYERQLQKPRIAGLMSHTLIWGLEHPILSGTFTFESKTPLYFDISHAARKSIAFTKGRLPSGNLLWKAEIKTPIFTKQEGEPGGILTTSSVSRLQISNQNSWTSVLEFLKPKFSNPATTLPAEFQKIVDTVKSIPKSDDRFNKVLELLHQTITYQSTWNESGDGYTPQPLANLVAGKRGDAKDFAFATASILRVLGHTADVTLVWRQAPTERVWIEERPTTPSLAMFNHAIVRVNEQGKLRYFDPTNSLQFAEGYLSDIGGSWSLTTGTDLRPFELLPSETAITSHVKITQTLDLRNNSGLVGTGSVLVHGPLAAELKQVYFAQGSTQVEPYLRSLFGLALKSEAVIPMIRVNTQDRLGRTLEIGFSYAADNAIRTQGPYREFEIMTPGLAGVPLLSNRERATDVLLSRNLTLEIETKVLGGELADETNTSCIALTSFASLLRETRNVSGTYTMLDHIQFRHDRINAASMRTPAFQNELQAYGSCLSRTRTAIGPRPSYEKSTFPLSAEETAVLKRPIANMNLQDVKILDQIRTPQLRSIVAIKTWLAARAMLSRGVRTPEVMLEYAYALLLTGQITVNNKDYFLSEHITEAAKLFSSVSVQMTKKTAKFHRVHAMMLHATGRSKEAMVALENAMATDKNQAEDSLFAGRIYVAQGDVTKAERSFLLASKQQGSKSTRLDAIENLAALRLRQNNIPEFISLYRQAIASSPRNAWVYQEFAKLLLTVKMWNLAIENSRKALTIMRFSEAESVLAEALIQKASTIYFTTPGIPTDNPTALEQADKLAVESIKYNRQEPLAYRIAGHASFVKALAGDYNALIATHSYFRKAIELGLADAWIQERYTTAKQSLEMRRPMAQVWAAYLAANPSRQNRLPATKPASGSTPVVPPVNSGAKPTLRFPAPPTK